LVSGIVGYGVYLPWCRIKVADMAAAWGMHFPAAIEKTVPFWDEDSITMATEAMQNAIKHAGINESEIDAIFFGTTTNPYLEIQGSSILKTMIETKPYTLTMDFTDSARSSTLAMIACMDAIESGSIKYGMVVGSDVLVAKPGSSEEYLASSGAGALIMGQENLIAEIEGTSSYTTEFTGRWRSGAEVFPKTTIERFEREYGFINHVATTGRELMGKLGKKPSEFKYAVFSVPDLTYPSRVAGPLGLTPDQIRPGMVANSIGYAGSSSVVINLAAALDIAKPGERIMMISYANGASDAFSILPIENIEAKRQKIVEKYLKRKTYVDYNTYLRWNRVFEKLPE
jgi:hydroxymethylglutaryl-CoA synthase